MCLYFETIIALKLYRHNIILYRISCLTVNNVMVVKTGKMLCQQIYYNITTSRKRYRKINLKKTILTLNTTREQ